MTNPNRVRQVIWRVTANRDDMREAENAILGDYTKHMSSCDWEPMDEDDDKPDNPEYSIEANTKTAHGRERVKAIWRIAGYLGARCMVSVRVDTDAMILRVDDHDTSLQHHTIHEAVVAADLHARMHQARLVLLGRDRDED